MQRGKNYDKNKERNKSETVNLDATPSLLCWRLFLCWPRYDFGLRPLTLKTLLTIPIYMTIFVTNFIEIHPFKYRDIASCEIGTIRVKIRAKTELSYSTNRDGTEK